MTADLDDFLSVVPNTPHDFRKHDQALGSHNEVDVGCARKDGFALLLCHTTGDSNDEGLGLLENVQSSEAVEHFFLRLFPHAAGIENDEIRFLIGAGRNVTKPPKTSRDLLGVVDIHLTAPRVDEVAR